MAFEQKRGSTPESDKKTKESDKKQELLKEISELSRKIEEAKAIADKYYVTAQDLEELQGKVQLISDVIKEKEGERAEVEAKLREGKDNLSVLTLREKKIAELTVEIKGKKDELMELANQINGELSRKEGELSRLDTLKADLESDVEALEESINEKTKYKAALVAEYDKVKNNFNTTQRLHLEAEEKVVEARKTLAKLDEEVEVTKVELSQIRSQVAEAMAERDKVRVESAKLAEDEKAKLAEEWKKIEEARGEISLKEMWLTNKERSLKEVKESLEQHLGKKLNINI